MESRSALVERIIIGTLLGVGREGPFRSERCRFKTLSLVGGERPARSRHRFWPLRQRHSCRARLNLADCTAYELAMTMNAPLLFKGDNSRRPTCGHAFELIPLPVVRMHRARRVIRARPLRLLDESPHAHQSISYQQGDRMQRPRNRATRRRMESRKQLAFHEDGEAAPVERIATYGPPG